MLLITGPTGNIGAELVDLLDRHPTLRPWRVASRHHDTQRTGLNGDSAEVVRLDFFDRATWDAALAGVKTLFLLFPLPGNRAARNAIIPFLRWPRTRDAVTSYTCQCSVPIGPDSFRTTRSRRRFGRVP